MSYLDSELDVSDTLRIRPALTTQQIEAIDLDLTHVLNVLGLRAPHPTEPADCTVLEVNSGDTTRDEAVEELEKLIAAVGDGHTYTGAIAGRTDFRQWRLVVRDGSAQVDDATIAYETESVVIERETLEEWAGRTLTPAEVTRIAEAVGFSSIPEAFGVIAESLTTHQG
jgi:hypothetical protein